MRGFDDSDWEYDAQRERRAMGMGDDGISNRVVLKPPRPVIKPQKRMVTQRPPGYLSWQELTTQLDEMYGAGKWDIAGRHVLYWREGLPHDSRFWSSYYKVRNRGQWFNLYDPHKV